MHVAVFPFYFILYLPYIGEYMIYILSMSGIITNTSKIKSLHKKLKKTEDMEEIEKIKNKIMQLESRIDVLTARREKANKNPYKIKILGNDNVKLLIIIMIICLLTGFLTPLGTTPYTYLVKTMQGNTTHNINEHLPLTLVSNINFMVVLIVFITVLMFTDTKIRLSDLFMLAGITFLSFNSRRQVSMFALFCMPILANLISEMVKKYDSETFKKIEKFVAGWFGSTVVVCICIISCTQIIKPTLREEFVDSSSYPVEAADWILANLDVENMKLYNEYNYGAYLVHRGIPVFIDSRCDLYSPEFNGTYNEETENYDGRDIFSDALNIAGLAVDYKDKFEEYGVTHVILYENAKLAMILSSDSDYVKLYEEGNFVIFERLTAPLNVSL